MRVSIKFFYFFFFLFFVSNIFAQNNFLPSDISGLQLWLRSDSGVAYDPFKRISQWNDLSGHSDHAAQTVLSNQPLFVDSVSSINYKPAIRFDGADDVIYLDSSITVGTI